MFLFPWSPPSPVVPCIDDIPYSNIYKDPVGSFLFLFCLEVFVSFSFFFLVAFVNFRAKIGELPKWTYLVSAPPAFVFHLQVPPFTLCLLTDGKEEKCISNM